MPKTTDNLTLKGIVAWFLREHGYDGLYCEDTCGCALGDLFPCGEPEENCTAGYKGPCTGVNCSCDGNCDFHIGSTPVDKEQSP